MYLLHSVFCLPYSAIRISSGILHVYCAGSSKMMTEAGALALLTQVLHEMAAHVCNQQPSAAWLFARIICSGEKLECYNKERLPV